MRVRVVRVSPGERLALLDLVRVRVRVKGEVSGER